MKTVLQHTRRDFLKASLLGGLAAATGSRFAILARAADVAPKTTSRVVLMAGDDRANNVFRGLKVFENEIARAIGYGSAGLFKTDGPKPVERAAFPQLANALYFNAMQKTLGTPMRQALDQAGSPQEWNMYLLSSPEFMHR